MKGALSSSMNIISHHSAVDHLSMLVQFASMLYDDVRFCNVVCM